MDYPSIPTDNLYKFIALGGLALMIFSVTYPANKALELHLDTIAVNAQVKKLTIEVENLEREITRVETTKVIERTDAEIKLLREKVTEQKFKSVDIRVSFEKAIVQMYWLRAYSIAAGLGLVLGIIFSNIGFILWYRRVQKPNDQRSSNFKSDN